MAQRSCVSMSSTVTNKVCYLFAASARIQRSGLGTVDDMHRHDQLMLVAHTAEGLRSVSLLRWTREFPRNLVVQFEAVTQAQRDDGDRLYEQGLDNGELP